MINATVDFVQRTHVSFQAIAWILAFMKSEFQRFYLFTTRFIGF